MTGSPDRLPRGRVVLGAVALCFVLGLVAGWALFMAPPVRRIEDEGYALIMVREWVGRGHLYDQVFSQYGPVAVLWVGLPARVLGFELGYGSARLLNLVLCAAAAALTAPTVWRLTCNVWSTVAAQAASFSLLLVCLELGLHPAALTMALVAATLAGLVAVRPARLRRGDVWVGCLLGLLLLTKINVGLLVAAGVMWAMATHLRVDRWRTPLRVVADVALVAVGPVLLLSQLPAIRRLDELSGARGTGVAVLVCWAVLHVSAAAALVGAAHADRGEPSVAVRSVGRVALSAMASSAVVATLVLATGTSVGSLVNAILVRPLGQGEALTILPTMRLWLVAWLAAPVGIWWLTRRMAGAEVPPGAAVAVATTRLVVACLLLVSSTGRWPGRPLVPIVSDLGLEDALTPLAFMPLLAFVAVPSAVSGLSNRFERHALAAVAITHSLLAFPVAGAQLSLAVVLHVVVAMVIASDGIAELALVLGRLAPRARSAPEAASVALCVAALAGLVHSAQPWVENYRSSPPMPGPGPALGARTDLVSAEEFRWFTTASAHCGEVVSMPGLNWTYLITGRTPPTGYNATLWPSLLTHDEQLAVVAGLEHSEGPVCLLEDPGFVSSLEAANGAAPIGPLTDYLNEGFERIASHGSLVLSERREL